MKEQRERLVELIKEAEQKFSSTGRPVLDIEEYVAGHLLSEGVILPSCKVGTPVYFLYEIKMFKGSDGGFTTDYGINIIRLSDIDISGFRIVYKAGLERFFEEDIGRTVFFTLEEAEKALAEREG